MESQTVVKNIRRRGAAVVLDLSGDIDLHTSIDMRGHLLELAKEKPSNIVLNMQDVGFMDSSGLATLVEALQLCRKSGGKIKLVSVMDRVKNLLEISRLDAIFPMYASESEAIA